MFTSIILCTSMLTTNNSIIAYSPARRTKCRLIGLDIGTLACCNWSDLLKSSTKGAKKAHVNPSAPVATYSRSFSAWLPCWHCVGLLRAFSRQHTVCHTHTRVSRQIVHIVSKRLSLQFLYCENVNPLFGVFTVWKTDTKKYEKHQRLLQLGYYGAVHTNAN